MTGLRNLGLGAAVVLMAAPGVLWAQQDSLSQQHTLDDVVVSGQGGATRSRFRIDNTELIGQQQLCRAACCNLGESFVANPSVDVNYTDAATGARQIKLLGLSGTYVQMLTENIPNLRGASIPYALGYVPGPWMQSIQVSKGASSVKNGYESTTGQINVEFHKPQSEDGVQVNGYLDSELKSELNLVAGCHLTDHLSANLLAHFEDLQSTHDGNHDNFIDMPRLRQWNVMPRVAYVTSLWISQLSARVLHDDRSSGQVGSHIHVSDPYTVGLTVNRYEAQWKNGFTLSSDRNMSVALMLHGSWHDASNRFGARQYDVVQKNGYAQLMFETDLGHHHNLSVGASLNHDYYDERVQGFGLLGTVSPALLAAPRETTSGLYAQYTFKSGEKLSVMAGLRADYSDLYRYWFATPRLHVRYSPVEDILTLRASAGKGYRTPHALAENSPMLASARVPAVWQGERLKQEEAWNYGLSASLTLPVADKMLEVNAEYYYTDFRQQMVMEYVDAPDDAMYYINPSDCLMFGNLHGKSFSHTLQVDVSYPLFAGFTAMAAFRYNDARTAYHPHVATSGDFDDATTELRRRPMTSQYKGLLTMSYKTPLELWQFDVTGQLNGHGVRYDGARYPTFFMLQAQVTRDFRHGSIYVGGENLTGRKISEPVIGAAHPTQRGFDATQVWGPTTGAMFYVGFRLNISAHPY